MHVDWWKLASDWHYHIRHIHWYTHCIKKKYTQVWQIPIFKDVTYVTLNSFKRVSDILSNKTVFITLLPRMTEQQPIQCSLSKSSCAKFGLHLGWMWVEIRIMNSVSIDRKQVTFYHEIVVKVTWILPC